MASSIYPVQSLMYITNRPELVFTEGKGSLLKGVTHAFCGDCSRIRLSTEGRI